MEAPALPVFAGKPAPTGERAGFSEFESGHAREEANAVAGTGSAGVRV
ncbi:hypothetical protein T1E_3512 [Pseudomonas putida DOT-T1E]|uniref:Uncharacterized protein n=1 Tax=Pseudomonas putida (strain DOT-T1E) TaxID=1196325 RepID=I7BCR1_PSEPT|nr:hypothetical protein T1E_3512 [Pseudomonas putida DOT-T1E]